jgi:hypothetical protein
MNIAHLVFQYNDFILTPSDCRNKYIARLNFSRLAREGKLSTLGFAEDNWSEMSLNSPFPLWADDLRCGYILVGRDHRIVGIVDWEFVYVVPVQFALDPPLWLLFEEPECWSLAIRNRELV